MTSVALMQPYPNDTRRLLLRTFVAQHCCGTFVARLSWAVAELRNKLWLVNYCLFTFSVWIRMWHVLCFSTLFYPSMSPNASFALISFFLHLLTKTTDNHTPEIKIPLSSVSLKPS